MTALRSFVALAAFTASSTALAGTPVARVAPLADQEPASLLGSVRYEHDEDLLAPVEDALGAEG